MEKVRLKIEVEGETPKEIIHKTLITLLRYCLHDSDIFYTGNWHEPPTNDERNCGRCYGTKHRHSCDVEIQLNKILTTHQDALFEFKLMDDLYYAIGVKPGVEALGTYEHEWFDEEDKSDDQVVDLTVHSKFAKYK